MTAKTTKADTADLSPMEKARAKAPAKAKGESVATVQPKAGTKLGAKSKADAAREAQLRAVTGLVRREQNGIKEPTAGGLCRLAWQACDKAMADLGRIPTSGEVAASKYAAGLNATNVKVEYSYWRRFHGHPRAALPPIGLVTKADKRTAAQEGKEA